MSILGVLSGITGTTCSRESWDGGGKLMSGAISMISMSWTVLPWAGTPGAAEYSNIYQALSMKKAAHHELRQKKLVMSSLARRSHEKGTGPIILSIVKYCLSLDRSLSKGRPALRSFFVRCSLVYVAGLVSVTRFRNIFQEGVTVSNASLIDFYRLLEDNRFIFEVFL